MKTFIKKHIQQYQPTHIFYQHVFDIYYHKNQTEKEKILIQKITSIGHDYYKKKFSKSFSHTLKPLEKEYFQLGLILLEKHKLQQIKPKSFFQKKYLQSLQFQKNISLFFLLHETHKKQKKIDFQLNEKSIIQDIQKFALQNDFIQIAILPDTPKTDFGSIPKSRVLNLSPQFIDSVIQKHLEKHLSPQKVINQIQLMKKIHKIHQYFQKPIEVEREKFQIISILPKPKPYAQKKILSPQEILTNIHSLRHQYQILSDDSALHYKKTTNGLLVEIPNKPFV
jgi:hypothetical protein